MTEPQLPIEYGDSGLVARNKINNSWTKLLEDVEAFRPSIGENGNWYIGTTDTGIHAEGYTTSFRVDSGYIQYKEENSNVWNNLIAVADLKGDTGNGIESVTATKNGKITTVTITFTEDETPYTFQISDGADGQDGRDGTDGQDGQDGQDGADGVGIASVTSTKTGKTTTVTISFTDGSTPYTFDIEDGKDGQGAGDVIGPASSTDGHLAVFDGATGKLIKDGGAVPTPTTVVDDLTTQSSTSALSANQGYVLDGKISTINGKIPSAATSSNQLADKNYVNDSINSVTAYYITKNAQGDQWATYAELAAATTFYSGGVVRVPTRNDYTIVLADETKDNATTRYSYNSGWEYQYTVNETALTQAQLNAINSGITSGKVSTYDGYASGKQDTLTAGTGIDITGATISNDGVTSVNGNTGSVTVNETIISSTAPANPTQGMVRYDTTNDELKSYDGSNWNPTGAVTSVNGQTGAVTVSEFSPTSAGSTDQVLTKTAGGYDWATPQAGGIQNDTVGTTTTIAKERCGTEAEYSSKVKEESVIYFTY